MKRKILVVDDSSTIRKYMGHFLTREGFEVVEACDGKQGLEAVAKHRDFSLVFCDINMPFYSGIQMLEKLNELALLDGVNVIMLTTEATSELIERARQAGAKGWMVKPVDPERLLQIANKLTQSGV